MSWSVDKMRELGTRHAILEARSDLEGVMATLVAEPVYEFFPNGLRMTGGAQVRRFYEEMFSSFIPRTQSYTLIAEWVSKSSLAQEYEIDLEIGGLIETHRVLGILFAEGELLGGERIYASERCTKLMTGDLYDDLEPI
jgi:hypothetical protein